MEWDCTNKAIYSAKVIHVFNREWALCTGKS
ncbi:hypothetical protein MES5069_450015 [Mesorhizobium escarrei]|uniref:Uncharacterized protein n=1 Tax=Mesorhizobium escarrei TaxID=666018 RepID=A0ABN8K421_9HYPH|nr:hypothetical protein MES5069_450015 [Mesorhizobium escarrei]